MWKDKGKSQYPPYGRKSGRRFQTPTQVLTLVGTAYGVVSKNPLVAPVLRDKARIEKDKIIETLHKSRRSIFPN